MQFPASVPVRALPQSAAAWARAAQQTRGYHYAAWGPDVLVDVHTSKLADALPTLDFVFGVGGRRRLPLHVIVFFLGRLGWVEDGSLAVDLASGLSAATLASFEAWADGDGRLDWSPTSETCFLQRVLALAAELATGVLPAELKVTADSFVPFEGHVDSANGPDWAVSWFSRMTVASLTTCRMLGPYADVILLFGPLLHEDVRTSPEGRPMLVAATLAAWASSGALSNLGSAHRHLPLLVATTLKERVLPVELSSAVTVFPAMLRDLDARLAYSDASKRPAVVDLRFPCALNALDTLGALLAGEAEVTKHDTACLLLAALLPMQVAPSLAAFRQLDRLLAEKGFDLSGGTAAERVDAIFARKMRDEEIERAAPYGGADGGSGGCAGSGTALVCDPKPRLHIKASVKVLQLWLDSSDVAGPIVYTVAPVAAAFGVAPVAGVPDETRSGVAALVNYFHERNDSMQVLRVALSRRAAPLTQAVVFDVDTPHPMFNAISSARGGLVRYVSTTLATLDDGTLEMECDGLWRASPGLVENLVTGKWGNISWFNDVLRGIELERCKSNAPAAITDPAHQWFGDRASDVVTLADRAFAILGFDRNDQFRSAAQTVINTAETTPTATAEAKASVKAHAVRQFDELLDAASTRFRLFLGARSLVPFPSFVDASDKASSMQAQAKAARQLLSALSATMPIMLHGFGGARADGGAAAGDDDGDDDNDDDDVGGGGGNSKVAKKQRRRLQQKARRPCAVRHARQLADAARELEARS